MKLPDGSLLQHGKYQISRIIGQGGFGITYRGIWHTELKGALGTIKTEIPICIKEFYFKDYCYRDDHDPVVKVHSESGRILFNKFREKLIKEAKILSDVHHPHIVNVLEVFEENGTAYIIMEYIDGYSLKHRLDTSGPLSEATALKYIRQIGEALIFVHQKNILHLDMKPSNILIDDKDNARLIDFGVSRRYDSIEQETSTVLLTLSKGFASIEQYDTEQIQNFSPCPDVYALGATLYNLLTNHVPTESILRAARPLMPPSEWNKSISPAVEAVILKAMEVLPEARYQSVSEMMEALPQPAADNGADVTAGASKSVQQTDVTGEKAAAVQKAAKGKTKSARQAATAGQSVTAQSAASGNDETILLTDTATPAANPHDADDDQTILAMPEPVKPLPADVKKHNRRPVAFILIILTGCIAAMLIYYFRQWEEVEELMPIALHESDMPDESLSSEDLSDTAGEMLQQLKQEVKEVVSTPLTPVTALVQGVENEKEKKENPSSAEDEPLAHTDSETDPAVADSAVTIGPLAATTERSYDVLLADAKNELAAGNYSQARQELEQAKSIALTEEVVRLLIACDEAEELQQIANRKALYESKRDFGKYTIVRKIANGRYGAIDEKGIEQIPCNYLNVGIADNGRAFEREDGLFDIYNSKGELIQQGATYY